MSGSVESTLHFKDFRVLKSYFEVHENAEPGADHELHLDVDVGILQSTASEDDMAVQLTVQLNKDDAQFEAAGFAGCIVINGFFDVVPLKAQRPEDWEPVLAFNGVTLLCGTVRTLFAELSAASPAGRIVIPAIDVSAVLEAKAAAQVLDSAEGEAVES
jgi:preprotein translocase subunit SecB